jgi:hypothetical protein
MRADVDEALPDSDARIEQLASQLPQARLAGE